MSRKFKSPPIDPSEITPESVYLSRRDILKAMGIVTATAALLAACKPDLPDVGSGDHKFQLWRFSHMKTVERIIGYKRGTGGTSGVAYLSKALELRAFPELWSIRTSM